jgi:HD-like signal output (HDOD) protein
MDKPGKDAMLNSIKGFVIPPRPDVLTRFHAEQNKRNPSLARLAEIVGADPGIAASVIRTVNSPYFGLGRKISSIQEAVSLMGVSNLQAVVTSLALIAACGTPVSMERFWDTAIDVALISRSLAHTVAGVSENDAFTLGVFHDCGIALLMQRMPDYKQFLSEANTRMDRTLPELEQQRYQTDHTAVGYIVAKAWLLPDPICDAIHLHHDRRLFEQQTRETVGILPLIAILKVASHLSHHIRGLSDADDWTILGPSILRYLGIGKDEFAEIETDMREDSTITPQSWISCFER